MKEKRKLLKFQVSSFMTFARVWFGNKKNILKKKEFRAKKLKIFLQKITSQVKIARKKGKSRTNNFPLVLLTKNLFPLKKRLRYLRSLHLCRSVNFAYFSFAMHRIY